MSFMQILSRSSIKNIETLIKCTLDRYPILIVGKNEESIENFMNGIASLISFRNVMIFYNDFISYEDYELILSNEENDYWTQRNVFLSYPYSFNKTVSEILNFQSWIIGYQKGNESSSIELSIFQQKLLDNNEPYLFLELKNTGINTKICGLESSKLNYDFEKWLYQNAISRTERTIEKMKRIISKGIKSPQFIEEEYDDIMNFSLEGEELMENMIKKEIINFYEASKRAFNILNRIKILESLDINISFSKRTLNSIVVYKYAPISRILEFIKAEWNLNFDQIFDDKKLSNFTDTFESLWG